MLLVTALLALVLAIVCVATQIMWDRAADRQAKKIMAEAQARSNAYYASLPARERPAVVAAPVPAVTAEEETPVVTLEQETPEWYIEAVPLDKQLQRTAFDAANENGVDYLLVLAVMQVESDFRADTVNLVTGCYGLMQLNPSYNPSGLSPEENIRAGTVFLGKLLEEYRGDEAAALRAYNRGFDDGDRAYSAEVLAAREEIMLEAGVVFP